MIKHLNFDQFCLVLFAWFSNKHTIFHYYKNFFITSLASLIINMQNLPIDLSFTFNQIHPSNIEYTQTNNKFTHLVFQTRNTDSNALLLSTRRTIWLVVILWQNIHTNRTNLNINCTCIDLLNSSAFEVVYKNTLLFHHCYLASSILAA